MPRPSTLVALAVLAIVAGCGGPPSAPTTTVGAAKPTDEPCRPVLTEPGEVAYRSAGVRTYPAPPGTPTTVTAQDALATPDVRSWGTVSAPEVELRLVSTGDFGCESRPTGAVRRAGWVVTLHGTAPAHGGPPGRPAADPAVDCVSVVVIDALTGALLSNFQACGEDPAVRSTVPG